MPEISIEFFEYQLEVKGPIIEVRLNKLENEDESQQSDLKNPNQEMKMSKITVSLIKADVGGYPGHSSVHPVLASLILYFSICAMFLNLYYISQFVL